MCRKRGDKFYMKGIQALAFVRQGLSVATWLLSTGIIFLARLEAVKVSRGFAFVPRWSLKTAAHEFDCGHIPDVGLAFRRRFLVQPGLACG